MRDDRVYEEQNQTRKIVLTCAYPIYNLFRVHSELDFSGQTTTFPDRIYFRFFFITYNFCY